jgi:hypothetical protein
VKPKERPRLDSEAIPNFLELRKPEVRRILFLRTTVSKGKKEEGPSTTGFVQTSYLGIGYGLKPCYGVAWEPGLGICFLVPRRKGRG